MLSLLLALSVSAHATPLHHCRGTATVGEHAVAVQGYGVDEATARRNAEQAGRQAAARLLSGQVWGPLMLGEVEALAEVLDGSTLAEPLAVPGATWEPGACTVEELTEAPAWQASVQGVTVERAELRNAASAARRQACEDAWSQPLADARRALAVAAVEDRAALLAQGLQAARDALVACHAAELQWQPLDKVLWDEIMVDGVAECLSFGPKLDQGAQGRGWGDSLDSAADAAAWERAAADALAPLAVGLDAMAHASAETKATMLAKAGQVSWDPLTDDLVERGLTSCRTLPAGRTLRWVPDAEELELCADSDQWSTFVRSAAENPDATRGAMCTAHAAESAAMVDEVLPRASEETRGTLRAAGWQLVLGCDVGCRAHSRLDGSVSPSRLSGVVPHGSQQAAAELLMAAVQAQDISMATLVVPTLAGDRARQALADDPARAWTQLEGLAYQLKARRLPPRARWLSVGADVVLWLED